MAYSILKHLKKAGVRPLPYQFSFNWFVENIKKVEAEFPKNLLNGIIGIYAEALTTTCWTLIGLTSVAHDDF